MLAMNETCFKTACGCTVWLLLPQRTLFMVDRRRASVASSYVNDDYEGRGTQWTSDPSKNR